MLAISRIEHARDSGCRDTGIDLLRVEVSCHLRVFMCASMCVYECACVQVV